MGRWPSHLRISVALAVWAWCLASPASAVNLVENPSFEDHGRCPGGPKQLSRASHWEEPRHTTPDYFHRCGGTPYVKVPNVFPQTAPLQPLTGDAYAGYDPESTNAEYLHGRLSSQLAAGSDYMVEFWVRLPDKYINTIDDIALHFSNSKPTQPKSLVLNLTRHVRNPPGRFLDDDQAWTLISGIYTADGGEDWITIGTFGQAAMQARNGGTISSGAYYFIDDVSVCTPPAIPKFSVQQEICQGSTILLQDAGTSDETGYFIEVYRTDVLGGDVVDGIYCAISPPGPLPATVDLTSECPALTFDNAGVYRVKLAVGNDCTTWNETVDWFTLRSAACCAFSAGITPPGPIDSCSSVVLNSTTTAGTPPFSYQWHTVSDPLLGFVEPQPPSIFLSGPVDGTFQVSITDSQGCQAQSPVVDVVLRDAFARMALPQVGCAGEDVILNATGSVAASYDLEVCETNAVGITMCVANTHWQSSQLVGTPGQINLSALYHPLTFDAGNVYRVALSVDSCVVGGTVVDYIVMDCCGACAEPPSDMVAWWPGEGNASDISPYLNHGTPTAGVGFAAGQVDQAFSIPGNADQVDVPDDPSLNFADASAGDFSIDLWFQSNAFLGFNADAPFVVKKSTTGYEFGYRNDFGAISPVLYLELKDASAETRYEAEVSPGISQWHHAAVTVDRNDTDGVIFYFDGVEVGSGDATQRPGSLSTTAGLALASNSGAIGVLLDEIEIFEREIDENDIGAIALAGSAGKCSERCTLPHVLSYCANQTQKTATLLVCNDSSVSHDFSVEFLRLAGRNPQTGQGCNVDGPADFTPSQANVTVAGGDCEEVTVQIDAPASFAVDTPGQSGCYLAQIVNLDTGSCESCRGMVRQIPQDFACAVPQQGGAATALSKTGITPVQFELENLSVAPVSIDYSIRSLPPDGDPTDPHLALDGLGVFDQVNGSTTLPAGQTDSVQVDVSVDRFQGFGLEQLLLSADVDGDGVYEAIGSRTLAPHPAPEPGVILQLVAGGVGLAFLNKRRLQKNRRAKPTS